VPDEAEGEVVRWIFRQVANEGHSIRRVAAALDREQTLRRRWRPSDVSRILHRKDYKTGPAGARVVDGKLWNRAHVALATRRRG
jgi:hypothetical protein